MGPHPHQAARSQTSSAVPSVVMGWCLQQREVTQCRGEGLLSRDPVMHGVSKKRGEASLARHTSSGPYSGHGSGNGGHRHRLEEPCTPKGSPYGIQQPREAANSSHVERPQQGEGSQPPACP